MLDEARREVRPLIRPLVASLGIFIAAFFAVTFLPVRLTDVGGNGSGVVTGNGWVGQSTAAHLVLWLEGFLLPHGVQLIALGPFDAFLMVMEMGMFVSLSVTIPFLALAIVRWVAVGLHPHERRAVRSYGILAAVLFVFGVVFTMFVVLPPIYAWSFSLQPSLDVAPTMSLVEFVGTTVYFCVGVGLSFEVPTMCVGLAYAGILSSRTMRNHWRAGVMGAFLLAFVISPGVGGGVIETLVAGALLMLYGFSYVLVRRVEQERSIHREGVLHVPTA